MELNQNGQIPYQYRPLSPWAYFGYSLLFSIPLVGFILLIVFSFSNENINRRNFARSFFCALLIGVIIFVVMLVLGLVLGVSMGALDHLGDVL
ncbi:MAG: ABC transporter permease [Clostridia bacterium]|nr:ABC transporter permease [Clostridia bacterium]